MSDNNGIDNDDLDVDDFDDSGFDTYNQKGTLGDMWRNNPMVKVGVILGALAVVIGAIVLFGSNEKTPPPSLVASPSDVTQAPGTSEVSQTMQDSIEEANLNRLEDATRTGGSVVPMPVDTAKGQLPLQVQEPSGEDPLERWRRMQEERIRQQEVISQQRPQQTAPPPVDTRTPAVNALSQSMVTQMQAVLGNQALGGVQHKNITNAEFLEAAERRKLERFQQQQRIIQANANGSAEVYENIFLPAGTIEYGQLLLEANTDAPGPVAVQIVSGPLKGSRMLGSFQSSDQYLMLRFNQIVIDGINYRADAVAIDPGTTLPGMVTEIDNRYFKRIILPMAAQFVSGLARAVSDSGTTTIVIEGGNIAQSTSDRDSRQEVASGIGAAGDELADILEDEADRTRPMLRLASGTPVGILFVAPVTDLEQTQ